MYLTKTHLLTDLLLNRAEAKYFVSCPAPLDILVDVKLLSVRGYSTRQEFKDQALLSPLKCQKFDSVLAWRRWGQ